ncbi:MAG: sulfotransferase [Verrucomicrobiota bacterium]
MMRRTPITSPGSLKQLLQAAEAARERMDFQTCIKTLQTASRLAPANVGVLLQLGRIHGLRYDYTAAERSFEQALRFAPRKTEMLTAIAEHCQNFRNPDIAERYLRRALEQPDATPQACIKLAELCERLRRLPEAEELVERALKLDPAYPAALLVRARLERLSGRLEPAEAVLRSFITQPIPNTWIHAQAWYELGHTLDRQGKFDEAMTAFLEAKTLQRPQADKIFDAQKIIQTSYKVMESNISAGQFRRWFENGPALSPARRVALLCGYARSGTTLLEQVLDAHPDIISAEETTIFLDDAFAPLRRNSPPNSDMLTVLETADNPALQQSRAAYFDSMNLSIGSAVANRLLLDKNPMFTGMIPAFIRIFPETRFLIALRDPRDVVLSRFMQALRTTPFTTAFLSLEGTVEDYAVMMSAWRKMAPLMPAPYLPVRYEDMVDDLESVARKTLDFLGVTWVNHVLGFDEHARKKLVRSPAYSDVTQPVYKRARGRWRNYQKFLEPHLEKLEPFVKAFGYE